MSTPAPTLLLICPQCGKKYSGDPNKPNARYLCPADKTALVRAEPPKPEAPPEPPKPEPPKPQAPAADSMTLAYEGAIDTLPPPPKSTSAVEERRSVLATLKPKGGHHGHMPEFVAKYEAAGKLGEGGMGEVLKVMDRDLKREVAMKRLRAQSEGTGTVAEEDLLRFVEEAQATGQLEHPNIIPVHDLGLDGQGRVYFTMKMVQGISLKQVIAARNEGRTLDEYSPTHMLQILINVCQGVAYAHNKGIIHRDLKPDNVMLGKFGEALVMDWGLAKILRGEEAEERRPTDTVRITSSRAEDDSSQTMEGSIAGTPSYMAPEQAQGKISELDERTDVYALGALLYEILSGAPPFRSGSALETLKMVQEGPPPALKQGTPGFQPIPRELKAICEKAMERAPLNRYQSATELRDDLDAYLEAKPVSAAPDNAIQKAIKWARRNRRQVQTSAVSAIIVLAVVLGTWFGWRQYTINLLLSDADAKFTQGRTAYQSNSKSLRVQAADPYASQIMSSGKGEVARGYRTALNQAIEPLRRVLDISPQHSAARAQLAAIYIELWRLALDEKNPELMRLTRAEVERYAGKDSQYSDELNGFGKLSLTVTPAEAEAFLFRFETLRPTDKDGNALPARLIPVPFDPKTRQSDAKFMAAELDRVKTGAPVPGPDRHSIFNLNGTPASSLGKGNVNVPALPPGSYLVLLSAPGRYEVRLPIRIDRRADFKQTIDLPKLTEIPAGFFFVPATEAIVGGETAGAPAAHPMSIKASLIYHDEMSMADYGEFLRDLAAHGKAAEAQQRVPRDFGKPLAKLTPAGLVPADGGDPARFAVSPVRGVSYEDAQAYVAWRAQRDGLPYRLPKDWEWEAACRGADGRKYSWGDQPGKGFAAVTQGYGDTGNNMSWKWQDYKDESPAGVHNLAGGAAEWTGTLFSPNAAASDPVFGQYAIRGNAWALPPVGLECAFRTSGQPAYFHPTIGFRIALDWPIKGGLPAGAATAGEMVHMH